SLIYTETQKESYFVNELLGKMASSEKNIEVLKIRRHIDEKLLDKLAGYYQGHIPISGIYAFLGILSCALYNFSYFVVSNEFSSNFGNTRYKGKVINHQWSKSYEFETLFQKHVENSISPDLFYFSLMRPFYEIRIAELFVNYKEYFPFFSSCNANFKIDQDNADRKQWCGKCPKCIFAFLLFSPFLSKEALIGIFGQNYFQNVDNLVTIRDILGFGKIKPFDCVGTFDEAKAAFYMAREKFRDDVAGEMFLPKIDPEDNRYFFYSKRTTLKIYFEGKIKPLELVKKVFKTQLSSVPDYMKFLGMQNALILGYGKEGKVTEEYVKQNFPELKIGVGDVSTDPDYLAKQEEYDIAVRSPGVRKELIQIPYTTATNIFFSWVKQIPGVKIIGVTGSKGKSTTASLIYHILAKAGKRAELLGNIGEPMLETLLNKNVKPGTIFVLELSSYQLDDIKFSPDIAVVTNIFHEHIDYHYNIKNYYAAKKNIVKYQQEGDAFIFNHKNKKILAWTKDTKAKPVPFAQTIPVDDSEILLQGKHNMQNIKAAIAVAKVLDIDETAIRGAIKTFKGLPHRLELIGEYSGIKFYDDAISTTPESTIEAIKTLPQVGTIFLGGQDRGYTFSRLEKIIKKKKIKNIVLFPESGKRIFRKGKKGLNILETASMDEAVKFAYQFTLKGQVCLLSCASPSYSLWKNFEEKGDKFQAAVRQFSMIKNNASKKTL
ncbi:MAG: UDP-N-acetylmuramoyl-L-alanine--D-glutamate ligase, partial [Candidatus Staskawiczbacteria bacterium]|nr:UDP-N-acetylmuramoyl-L-alanine--D-glutamate ligase [Candidatus Staskawiczbacteria bacterium]